MRETSALGKGGIDGDSDEQFGSWRHIGARAVMAAGVLYGLSAVVVLLAIVLLRGKRFRPDRLRAAC